MKWNESGFRPPLCTYRLNWARRTSWGWWDDWDDTVLQTQDSKFEPWRSEAEHATSRSRRLPKILTFTRGWGRNNFISFKPPRPGTEPRTLAWKAAVLTTTLGPPPLTQWMNEWLQFCIINSYENEMSPTEVSGNEKAGFSYLILPRADQCFLDNKGNQIQKKCVWRFVRMVLMEICHGGLDRWMDGLMGALTSGNKKSVVWFCLAALFLWKTYCYPSNRKSICH